MFSAGQEIRLDRYRTNELFKKPNAQQSFVTKVYQGQVVDYDFDTDINGVKHWCLKVRQYLPISVNSGTVQFDDGSLNQLAGAVGSVYIKVSVVNCVDSERIKSLFLVGDKITYFNGRWPTDVMADDFGDYQSSWITVHPTEEFYALVTSLNNDFTINWHGGYIDPTQVGYFTTITGFTGTTNIVGAVPAFGNINSASLNIAPNSIMKIKPIWNSLLSSWGYILVGTIGITGTFPAKIVAVTGGFPNWLYTCQKLTKVDWNTYPLSSSFVVDGNNLAAINRMEFSSPTGAYPYVYGNGCSISASDGTVNGGSCKIIPIGVGATVDLTAVYTTGYNGFLFSFAQANSAQ